MTLVSQLRGQSLLEVAEKDAALVLVSLEQTKRKDSSECHQEP